MQKISKLSAFVLWTIGFLVLVPPSSDAFILLEGTGPLGSFSGSLDYSFSNATTAELEIILQNTSPADNGGFLTAFVFNNPNNSITGISLTPSDTDFGLLGGSAFNNGVNGAPYGKFDIGASTGGSFNGSGNPSKGIAVGASETFLFSLTGTNLNTLVDQSFLDELSDGTGSGQGYQSFVSRFRGFEDNGSDKVPYSQAVVPEPSTLLLFGGGALSAFFRRRR